MLNGLYTVARGMIAFKRENDVLANNLANVNTTGFKSEQVVYQSFPEILMSRLDESGEHFIGSKGTGSKVVETFTNFQQGHLQKTDNPLDLAIEGPGFFVVQTPWGIAYTRSGHFTLNQFGQLVTEDGYPVLGENGPIETFGKPIAVGEDGIIEIDGVQSDRIRLVDFADLQQLEKVGKNLYRAGGGIRETRAEGLVRQGYLEGSNVNVILGMTQLITATRLYEVSQKMIQSQDETLSKAVNDVGRTNG
ncbi:flagellar basal-body rod protein FlgF [Anoxybacter fermentans]|uniref:Flagellar basal-body rod protein FlgF n=1 Tax=Anoxybacter fermentans TaxID=1323375 RepID=A0A3Q9HRQ5_9FIRM|nr:flagellar basal-body rod protein FlgF [Anoxybacter fermentans]AZR73851.1 flagellar basal-body rod protein FlgF [Anoxybacter fermentans]